MTFAEHEFQEAAYSTALIRSLQHGGVKFLRFLTVDVCNNIRCKAVPIEYLLRNDGIVASLHCLVSVATVCYAGLPFYADSIVQDSGMDARNQIIIKPDLFTLRVLPYAPKTAMVLGTLHDQYSKELSPVCTRGLLAKIVKDAAERHNIAFSAGAELEFCLRDSSTGDSVDDSAYGNSITLNDQETFISDLYDQLKEQRITAELIHAESGPGQLEVVLRYLYDPVQLADAVLLTRETIRSVARAHSLKALFIPKYDMMKAGNGLHVHLSIRDQTTGRPIFSNGASRLSTQGSAFVEGILRHLPALMGVTMPTTNSFRRVSAGCWTGFAVGCWALEDKEAGIRVCSDLATQEWTNVEFKFCDSSCNLYMGLASILACGLNGIAEEFTLRPPLCADASLAEPPPASLPEALKCLEKDELLNLTLGLSLMKGHLALRRNEAERAANMTLEDEIKEWLARA